MQKISKQLNFLGNNSSSYLFTMILWLASSQCNGLTYDLPFFGNTVGAVKTVKSEGKQTLLDIAQIFDIGAKAIADANPKLINKTLEVGTEVVVPSQFRLPSSVPREGVVVNLSDMRVYYFHPSNKTVSTYPIGIGKEGWDTPTGQTTVLRKKKNPNWYPPASIKRAAERRGKILPDVVLAGPNNPLGQYAIYLGIPRILIHGTNKPTSVGLRSSHGCIRMYAPDIAELFTFVQKDTPVAIIYEPQQNQ